MMKLGSRVARVGVIELVILLAFGLLGCGGALRLSTPVPERPACASGATRGKPVFCMPESRPAQFVVGLPAGHGWDRGDWVMLEVPTIEGRPPRSVAMATVSARYDKYPDLVEVKVLYQTEARSLEGALARRVNKDSRARLGKFIGRVAEIELSRIRVDLGKQDGVVVGDVYEVLSERDHVPIGRVRVTEVGEQHAWGIPLGIGAREELRWGQDVVFSREIGGGDPVRILVVNFDPYATDDPEEDKTGRGFAKELADALAKGAEGSLMKVSYAEKEQVKRGAGEAEAHKSAQQIGRRYGSDIVVWGMMRCGKRACAQPRFTVVDPRRFRQHRYDGAEIWMNRDDAGFRLKGDAPEDPLVLAAAILGRVAYEAEQYRDAAIYLGRGLAKGLLQGEDAIQLRYRLAHAFYVLGQSARARQEATKLLKEPGQADRPLLWERGRGLLAQLDMQEGRVDSARAAFEEILRLAEQRSDAADAMGDALHALADLEKQQGRVEKSKVLSMRLLELSRRSGNVLMEVMALDTLAGLAEDQGCVDEARKLIERAIGLSRSIGQMQAEAATLRHLAYLEAQQGRGALARKLYTRALELLMRIGDIKLEAGTLHSLAQLEAQQGRVQEARSLYTQVLERMRRIGFVKGEAVTLYQLAQLIVPQGEVEEARAHYVKALLLFLRIGHEEGESMTIYELARLEDANGHVEEARKSYARSLKLMVHLKNVQGEAAVLHELALLEEGQGRVEEARKLNNRALELCRRMGFVKGELTTIVDLAALDRKDGKIEEARRALQDVLVRARAKSIVEVQASILSMLGKIDLLFGDFSSARQHWNESLEVFRRLNAAPKVELMSQQINALPFIESSFAAWKDDPTLLAQGGILILAVKPGSPAEKAGIAPGDVLLSYGTTHLDKEATFDAVATNVEPTKTATIEILRGTQKLSLQVQGGLRGTRAVELPPRPTPVSPPKAKPAASAQP